VCECCVVGVGLYRIDELIYGWHLFIDIDEWWHCRGKEAIKWENSDTITCIGHCIFPMHNLFYKKTKWNILQEQSSIAIITWCHNSKMFHVSQHACDQ
jgi:hypothetical protein